MSLDGINDRATAFGIEFQAGRSNRLALGAELQTDVTVELTLQVVVTVGQLNTLRQHHNRAQGQQAAHRTPGDH